VEYRLAPELPQRLPSTTRWVPTTDCWTSAPIHLRWRSMASPQARAWRWPRCSRQASGTAAPGLGRVVLPWADLPQSGASIDTKAGADPSMTGPALPGGALPAGSEPAGRPLERALDRGQSRARGADRIIRMAWTFADLARPGPAAARRDRHSAWPVARHRALTAEAETAGHGARGQLPRRMLASPPAGGWPGGCRVRRFAMTANMAGPDKADRERETDEPMAAHASPARRWRSKDPEQIVRTRASWLGFCAPASPTPGHGG
jgi:hypothetical protein